ncbi:hypothetical protein [Pelosinus propionicus]|uniref:Uncharacterized protein n=1 Tax=Pelosinus propionicus DSM 13327 TaxID=1123291 RepID=A0A1I4PUB6_9FIRM|nr:hypothetical protein [Pelosinus propionicus]SFM31146.1 hypothetical protein SAMN04490355_107231 [Pelosinus propionicus DSM 13327]
MFDVFTEQQLQEEQALFQQQEQKYFQLQQEEAERNQAAVILENELKNQREQEQREQDYNRRYDVNPHKDLLTCLFDAAANAILKQAEEWRRGEREKEEANERQKMVDELAKEAQKYLTEAKTIFELEKRNTEVKKAFESLDREYKHTKGDTSQERLLLNKHINVVSQAQESIKIIKDKEQEISFNNRQSLQSELKRCYEKENVIEYKISNSDLKEHIRKSTDEMKEQSAAATTKMKEAYEKSKDWVSHERRDPHKYYYGEPANLFTGQGIPKDSPTGKILSEHIETRNKLENGIRESAEIQTNLSKVPPDHEYHIKVNRTEDIIEKIREKAHEVAQSQERARQPEHEHEMSR